MRIRITENQLKLILEAGIAQPKEEYLRKLFNSEVFKNKLSFSPEEILQLKQQGIEINDVCNQELYNKYNIDTKGHIPRYCYNNLNYVNAKSDILIGCKIHKNYDFGTGKIGYFNVRPDNHNGNGSGCPECEKEKSLIRDEINRKGLKKFLQELIIDKISDNHFFTQNQLKILKSSGIEIDDKCNQELFNKFNIDTKGRMPKYCYDKVIYKNNVTNVLIGCKIHGYFNQRPKNHLRGEGCPTCNDSKNEIKIANILENLSIEYIRNKKFEDCFGISDCVLLKFDFYLPKYDILIEFDGKYHFEPVRGEERFKEQKENDRLKNEYCKNKNLKLLRISYSESKNLNNIIIIKNLNNLKKGVTFIGKEYL